MVRCWICLGILLVTLWVGEGWWAGVAIAANSVPSVPAVESEEQIPSRVDLDPSRIPSEKISQFVHACVQVVKLIDSREGELQSAETESESLRIEREIEAAAIALIEQAGLTRQEYIQLLGLANTDPEFGERVALLLQEAAS